MPCIVCGAAANANTAGWAVGELCDLHYATLQARYAAVNVVNVRLDIIKVHVLLQYNTPLCMIKMGLLSTEIGLAKLNPVAWLPATGDPRFVKAPGVADYVKLSRALEYYEGYCWFPATRALLGGLLSASAFFEAQRMGLNKDPGAGKAHGDQSHRLQWHAIMRCMTSDFTLTIAPGWHHTPLQLFYQFSQVFQPSWGLALDAQINAGWGNPDNVVASILSSPLLNLRDALDRRSVKLGGPSTAAPLAKTAMSPRDLALLNAYAGLCQAGVLIYNQAVFDKIIPKIYTWEKYRTGVPAFTFSALDSAAKQVYQAAVAASPNLFGFSGNYKEKGTNLLVNRQSPDPNVRITAGRATASGAGFNTGQYAFDFRGAHPLTGARF